MGLLELASKHSLLGENTPFGDTTNGEMVTTTGPRFADWRNTAFPSYMDPEPDHQDIMDPTFDSVLEKLLYSNYTYNRGGEPEYSVTVPNSPSRGLYADLWDGDPPVASYNAFGKYDGITHGPEDGTYWAM